MLHKKQGQNELFQFGETLPLVKTRVLLGKIVPFTFFTLAFQSKARKQSCSWCGIDLKRDISS